MNTKQKDGIAFFDFDDTLVHGDSLVPFLVKINGWTTTIIGFIMAIGGAVFLRLIRHPSAKDLKTLAKTRLLIRLLGGVSVEKAHAAAQSLRTWVKWRDPQVVSLWQHLDKGHTVVVSSGALMLYLPVLLEELGVSVDAVMGTEMEVVDGKLTGRMAGANCVRKEKARRVAAFLEEHGPFADTWGYGNAPSDLPMLAILNHKTLI